MTGYMSKHMRHDCQRRGCYLALLPQWDDFIDQFPRGIRPTDVDGMVEIGGRFLFMEEKSKGVSLNGGQLTAFTRLGRLPNVTVVVFRPGEVSDLEVLILDGSPPAGFQPRSRSEFKAWLWGWALRAEVG